MKIAHLASTFLPRLGGAETMVHNLALYQQRAGWHPCGITWWGLWRQVRRFLPYRVCPLLPRSYTIKHRQVWERGEGSAKYMAAQIFLYQSIMHFDAWHIHMAYPAGILAIPMLRRLNCAVILTCQGDDLIHNRQFGFTLRENAFLDQAIMGAIRACDRVVAISRMMTDEYVAVGVPRERIDHIPNGVNFERIRSAPVDVNAIRDTWGIPRNVFVILTVGRNHAQKGFQQIPDLLRQVRDRGADCYWVLVGSCDGKVWRKAIELGVTPWLRIIPPQGITAKNSEGCYQHPSQPLIDAYKAANLFAMTSLWESFGNVMIEAMAAGLPVVSFETAGALDILDEGKWGLLSPVGDLSGFAEHIVGLAMHAQRCRQWAQCALSRAQDYDWRRVGALYTESYQKVFAQRVP